MADWMMAEIKIWLDNLCYDADKKGLPAGDMWFLLTVAAQKYAIKERDEYYRLQREMAEHN